jgi:guanylate kinase
VYAGNFYGTLKSEIERVWAEGKDVIFDVVLVNEDLQKSLAEAQRLYDGFKSKP